jgi:hypothetical protein
VIAVSRVGVARAGGPSPRSAWKLLLLAWHIGCIGIGAGCFYIAPVKRPTVNRAPDVITSTESPVLLDRPIRLQVVARDPDGDDVWFFWEPSEIPAQTTELDRDGEVVWLSTLDVSADQFPEGGEVRCTVSDLDEELSLRWTLQVEE